MKRGILIGFFLGALLAPLAIFGLLGLMSAGAGEE